MQVIEFIKEKGLEALTSELGIKVKDYPEHNLVVLNYSQIDSPKTHPVVRECRGLILQRDNLKVLCRPFDRFFNAGEAPETVEDFDITRAVALEKVDGSLIKIWCDRGGKWRCATRGTAFAESSVNDSNLTFAELVYRAVGCEDTGILGFQGQCEKHLERHVTYLFELTSQENRVVTRYEGTTLWYLGARETETGIDLTDNLGQMFSAKGIGAKEIKHFKFDTLEHALEASQGLKDLQEGYVLFDKVSHKRIKVKSPAYVAVHHLRGEGLNPKRIKQLVLTNEQDEYLKYFPEDADFVDPYVVKLALLESNMSEAYNMYREELSQKDFALKVKDFGFSAILFQARQRGLEPYEVWASANEGMKYKIFSNFVGE